MAHAAFVVPRRLSGHALAARLLPFAAMVIVLAATNAGALAQVPAAAPVSLAAAWQAEHVISIAPALLDHDAVVLCLQRFVRESPRLFSIEEIGRSVEGRSIQHLWFGRGPFQVLLWSQMHGDEPTATAALLDLAEHVRRRQDDTEVRALLDALTIHIVPMLNPDGAELFQRRNAQGIDINRDALLLQSPEGRALKALRDRLKPSLGFNLHNQNWRTSAGKTGKPASFSLLAVALDEARTETPARTLAKKTCAVVRDALEPFVPGQVARYDDEFEVRAFGDNITKWGTPVVLIETGPYAGAHADAELQKLNFVAILSALEALASGRVHEADRERYESLPVNESNLFTVVIRNASIVTGTGIEPFTGDVGLTSSRVVRRGPKGAAELVQVFRVDDLGDLRVFAGLETIDAIDLFLAPSDAWTAGSLVSMPDWKAYAAPHPLRVGTSTRLALLQRISAGTYRVARILPTEVPLGSRP